MIAALTALVAACAGALDAFTKGGGVDLVLAYLRARTRTAAAQAEAARVDAFREALERDDVDATMAELDRLDRDLDAVGVRADAAET